ncbi:Gfo/Idh/MocA family oxidoreductase [Alteromonas sp. D210916BOD_24]|uniref:Gfo/Idh/MocA family protein n=1 Tax=Alteromonas sp. D210916BOD_24 TaxID=3157618 RepID=UPI00399CAF9F
MSKKFAVVGLGSIAERHRRNIRLLWPDSKIYAVSSSGRVPQGEIANCDELLDSVESLTAKSIDMAIVASPAPFHAPHAVALIQAGIPTLIEKPLSTNLEDANAILQCAAMPNNKVAVGYCLRFLPSALLMKTLIKDRKVGQIVNVFIEVGQYLPDWRPTKNYRDTVSAKAELGGGALFELSHEFDYCQWIFGELSLKHAYLRSSSQLQLDVEDIVDVVATLPDGALVNIHLDFLQKKAYRNCRVVGSHGVLNWDLIHNSVSYCDGNGDETIYSEAHWDKNQMYTAMLSQFVTAPTNQASSAICTPAEAFNTVHLIDSIKNSCAVLSDNQK